MPDLRNRKTKENFVTEHNQTVPAQTFNQTHKVNEQLFFNHAKKATANRKIKKSIIDDLKTRLPHDLAQTDKSEFIQFIETQINTKEFDALLASEKTIKSVQVMVDKAKKLSSKQTDDGTSIGSFVKSLCGSFASTLLGSHFPIAMLALTALPVIAAQMNTTTSTTLATTLATTSTADAPWQIHEDMPQGGIDLCKSVLFFGCLQGYLTKGSAPWSVDLPQFNRILDSIKGSVSVTDSTYTTWRDCLDINKLGQTVIGVLKTSEGNKGVPCVSNTITWGNYKVTGQATNLANGDCIAFQNAFSAAALNCQDAWARVGRNAAITGGVIGGVLGLVCIVGLVLYCCNKSDSCETTCSP